jgi:hypothetical protein
MPYGGRSSESKVGYRAGSETSHPDGFTNTGCKFAFLLVWCCNEKINSFPKGNGDFNLPSGRHPITSYVAVRSYIVNREYQEWDSRSRARSLKSGAPEVQTLDPDVGRSDKITVV